MAARSIQSAPGSRSVAFDDLPGEIRNEIYKLVLVNQFPIKISRYDLTHVKLKRGIKVPQWPREYKMESRTTALKGKQKRKASVKQVLNISVLLVSKLVNYEASQILFGENCFVFETAPAVESFCDLIGNKKTSLRNVELNYDPFSQSYTRQFSVLSGMGKPQRIVVAPSGCGIRDASAELTWQMIKGIVMLKAVETRDGNGMVSVKFIKATKDEQIERLNAFVFDVSKKSTLNVPKRTQEDVNGTKDFQGKLSDGVWACWQKCVEKAEAKRAKAEARADRSST